MRPSNLTTKIFIDGGDPQETEDIIHVLGFLDGQTTNPSLISRNPEAQVRVGRGKKFTKAELLALYRGVVRDVAGRHESIQSVSIEVYADKNTTADEMFTQGKDMYAWTPKAHVKYPTTSAGLAAAEKSVAIGMRVNMTLVFSQAQAAAVYAATKGAIKGQVFLSPFIGRLDDKGENGMYLVKNILQMYRSGDGHVEVLTASVRSIDHVLGAIHLGSDLLTAPYKVLKEWGEKGLPLPEEDFV
ncbi:MAG: transaldolase family protein, partial [Patescibacteria group bacterium]